MAHYNPEEIAEMKKGREKAKKMKPPKRKHVYVNDKELIEKFKIYHLETNLNKKDWIKREDERRKDEMRRLMTIKP